jgi:hypothetical protein
VAPLVPGDAVVEQYRALLGEKIQLDDESSSGEEEESSSGDEEGGGTNR